MPWTGKASFFRDSGIPEELNTTGTYRLLNKTFATVSEERNYVILCGHISSLADSCAASVVATRLTLGIVLKSLLPAQLEIVAQSPGLRCQTSYNDGMFT